MVRYKETPVQVKTESQDKGQQRHLTSDSMATAFIGAQNGQDLSFSISPL